MPLLSVITAAYQPKRDYLLQAWESLVNSQHLGDWEWEWCIQEDGLKPDAREWLPPDERIHYEANTVHVGAAATRNAALARARGTWIMNLDCDDWLLPEGMATLIAGWVANPGVIWAAGRAHDYIDTEQQLVEFPNYLPDGLITSSVFMDSFEKHQLNPVHFAGAAMDANVMRALGGYFASPVGEDVALWFAAVHLGQGVYTSDPVFVYRQWDGQSTKGRTCLDWTQYDVIGQRIEAMRAIGLVPSLDPRS